MVRFRSATFKRPTIGHGAVVLGVSLLLAMIYNGTFWGQVLATYPLKAFGFLASLSFALFAVTALLVLLIDWPKVFKPLLIALILASAVAAYFMDAFKTVIDHAMIANAFQTDTREVGDLMNLRFLAYVGLLGLVPSLLILMIEIKRPDTWRKALTSRVWIALGLLVPMTAGILVFNRDWTSFLREHKAIRQYANPGFLVYSIAKFATSQFALPNQPVKPLGEDARIPAWDRDRELFVFVVGESARADHFSLNGYSRQTNPLLSQEQVISYTNMRSNATSTAESLPLIFSGLGTGSRAGKQARTTENLLDVMSRAGVNVLWRDNNSDSKGVAKRIAYESFRQGKGAVGGEVRDETMLEGLQAYIDSHPKGDILIVLHQMGNHGPAYFKRYPKAFDRFQPSQRTQELGECTPQEITNAYDNAILYTDHFLDQVIALLRRNDERFETGLVYTSDHGESLGEKGVYLHGMPYFMAPEEQKRVATVFWFGRRLQAMVPRFRNARTMALDHTTIFHTLLGLYEIESKVYDPRKDIARIVDPTPPELAERTHGAPQKRRTS